LEGGDKMRALGIGAVAAAFALGACASSSDKIAPAYVSPYQFDSWNCQQIAQESEAVSHRAAQLAGVQDAKRRDDTVATTVAVVVFWPAAFFVGGNDQSTAELAQMRGQMQALEQVARKKNCNIQFQRTASAQ
jgi:hypothetical protein